MSEQKNPASDAPKNDEDGTTKPAGVGDDNTIPNHPDGVAAGYTGEDNTFEPEEA